MPEIGMNQPPDLMRETALRTLAELAGGRFPERMRIDAAARIVITARRLAVLTAAGEIARPRTGPVPADAPEAVVAAITSGWDPEAVTATEYAEALPSADLDLLLQAAPAWAVEVWARRVPLPDGEKQRRLSAA
jgi:hypothetical protein